MEDDKKVLYDKYTELRKQVRDFGIQSLSPEDKQFYKNFWTILSKS